MPTKHDIKDVECLHYYDDEISSCGCGFIGFKKSQVFDYNFGDDDDDGDSEELFEINMKKESRLDSIREEEWCESSTVFSLDIHNYLDDVVYVAVGTNINGGSSSMEALSWTLKHAVTPETTTVYLLHVFPQVKLIPTPLGKIPRSHVNVEHVNIHLTQVKSKRKLLLQKFMKLCIESEVKVEMMLIEGDNVGEAIVDLVGNLNIRKLVIGTTQSNLSKKGPGKQNSIADMVLKTVQESCDVKIICEGKEVIDQMINGFSTSKHTRNRNSSSSTISHQVKESHGFVPLKLFMPNLSWLFRSRFLSPR
ncbi:uncharacterized protein [Medicago truncatula]|nr:uncharacterized protein LOC25494330 isoform X2 [Medicago truncatula]